MSTPVTSKPSSSPAAPENSTGELSTTPTAAFAGIRKVPPPVNDPNRTYAPGSPEKLDLKARLKTMAGEKLDIPLVIGGKEIRTGHTSNSVMPHDHKHVLATYHMAGPEHIPRIQEAQAGVYHVPRELVER